MGGKSFGKVCSDKQILDIVKAINLMYFFMAEVWVLSLSVIGLQIYLPLLIALLFREVYIMTLYWIRRPSRLTNLFALINCPFL